MRSNTKQSIRLLLIEDTEILARTIKRELQQAKYVVDLAFDCCSAATSMQQHSYDLLILDLSLPDKDGLTFLAELRAQGCQLPVLILSARGSSQERVTGLRGGADDYLTKPFDSGELLARIEALLRRSHSSPVVILRAGDLTLDVVQRKVMRNNREILLTPREYALLQYFLQNKNVVLTRSRIAEQVWGYDFNTGTNVVDVYISYLRKAIGDGDGHKLLHTIPGEGFILKDE
jgi:two-component system, OmpR family, copper resistance phosphate regulon response regulator CusR